MKKELNNTDIFLVLIIFLLSLLLIYTVISLAGPSWDLMVRYLDGRTLLNFLGGGISPQGAFVGEFSNNMLYYFEPYREPLSTPIFAFLTIFFQKPIFEYLVLLCVGYSFAVYKFSKKLDVDILIAFCVFFNSYIILFFTPNGGEGLSLIFVILGVAYLLRKSEYSGLLFALAGLAKYQSLVLFPVVLLLGDGKKIVKAVCMELAVVLLWCIFDFEVYGNPFYSFISSLMNSNALSAITAIDYQAVLSVLLYPIAFAVIILAIFIVKKKRIKIKLDYNAKVFLSIIVLSGLEYAVTLPHNDIVTQARYGYLFSIALLLPISLTLSKLALESSTLKYSIAVGAIVVLIFSSYLAYSYCNNYQATYYNPNTSNGGIYSDAYAQLTTLGFNNCRFISNAWVPMLYSGYDAYSPFIVYQNSTITPIVQKLLANKGISYSSYQNEEYEYPIIVFKYIGVQKSFIVNLNESDLAYDGQNFSIYLPQNARCYTN